MTIRVSAPGKAILMGEHAAVYGHPALVAAVDRRVTAELRPAELRPVQGQSPEGTLELVLPDVGVHETVPWSELRAYADRCRRAWEAWSGGSGGELASVLGTDPAHVVKVAVGEALGEAMGEALGQALGQGAESEERSIPSGILHLRSELPVGSGFGSSAAVGIAALGAVSAGLGQPWDRRRLEGLALEVERRQHGSPSGVDGATVLHGGVLWVERRQGESGQGELKTTPLGGSLAEHFAAHWRVCHSGEPEPSTGEVVAHVRRLRDRDPASFDAAMDRAREHTGSLRCALEQEGLEQEEIDGDVVRRSVRSFQAWLESLGVVPEPVRRRIRQVEAAGGAAKISGAGASRGPGAGSILVYHPEPDVLRSPSFDALLGDWRRLDLGLGAPGARLERA